MNKLLIFLLSALLGVLLFAYMANTVLIDSETTAKANYETEKADLELQLEMLKPTYDIVYTTDKICEIDVVSQAEFCSVCYDDVGEEKCIFVHPDSTKEQIDDTIKSILAMKDIVQPERITYIDVVLTK